MVDAGVERLGYRVADVLENRVRTAVETGQRLAVPLLDLHLIGPSAAELRCAAFGGALPGELDDLLGQGGAEAASREGGDDRQLRRSAGDDVPDLSLHLGGRVVPRVDVRRLLLAVGALVGDRVDRPLDEHHLAIAGPEPAVCEIVRVLQNSAGGPESPGIVGAANDAEVLEIPLCGLFALHRGEVTNDGVPEGVVSIGERIPVSSGLPGAPRRVETRSHSVEAFVGAEAVAPSHEVYESSSLDGLAGGVVGPALGVEVLGEEENLSMAVGEGQPLRILLHQREMESLRNDPGREIDPSLELLEEGRAQLLAVSFDRTLDASPSPLALPVRGSLGAHDSAPALVVSWTGAGLSLVTSSSTGASSVTASSLVEQGMAPSPSDAVSSNRRENGSRADSTGSVLVSTRRQVSILIPQGVWRHRRSTRV